MRSLGIASQKRPFIASVMRWRNIFARHSPLLADDGLKFRVRERTYFWIAHQHSRTGVPAQNSIIVSMRAEGLSLFVVFHRFAQRVIGVGVARKTELAEVRV